MKKNIFFFMLGVVIASSISVLAHNYKSEDVTYTPNDNNWNVNNVKDAINDLHEQVGSSGFENLSILDSSLYEYDGSSRKLYLYQGLKKGTYFVVSGGTVGGGGYTSFSPSLSTSSDVTYSSLIAASDGTGFVITVNQDLSETVTISGSASGVGVYLTMYKNSKN